MAASPNGKAAISPSLTLLLRVIPVLEQERDAPQRRCADDGVDDAAEQRCLAAEDPRHQVELEHAYQQPVDAADDRQQQGYGINHG